MNIMIMSKRTCLGVQYRIKNTEGEKESGTKWVKNRCEPFFYFIIIDHHFYNFVCYLYVIIYYNFKDTIVSLDHQWMLVKQIHIYRSIH